MGLRAVCGTTAREWEVQHGLVQVKSRRWNMAWQEGVKLCAGAGGKGQGMCPDTRCR